MVDQKHDRKIILLIAAIAFLGLVSGVVNVVQQYTNRQVVEHTVQLESQNASLAHDLKVSSARSECRNRLNNESIGNFQVDIRDLLVAGFNKNTVREAVILNRLASRPNPNVIIKKLCPPALALPSKGKK